MRTPQVMCLFIESEVGSCPLVIEEEEEMCVSIKQFCLLIINIKGGGFRCSVGYEERVVDGEIQQKTMFEKRFSNSVFCSVNHLENGCRKQQ